MGEAEQIVETFQTHHSNILQCLWAGNENQLISEIILYVFALCAFFPKCLDWTETKVVQIPWLHQTKQWKYLLKSSSQSGFYSSFSKWICRLVLANSLLLYLQVVSFRLVNGVSE